MGLLDDLEQEAQRRKASLGEAEKARAEREHLYQAQLDPAMQAFHEYLGKLTANLAFLKPKTQLRFEIPGYGPLVANIEHEYDLREAAEAATLGGDELVISDRPGPAADDVGPLTKYGVIYGPTGEILAQTPSWKGSPPPRAQLPEASGSAFDLWSDAEHLRGTHVAIPAHPGTTMLLAAPRSDLDGDEHFLQRAMATVFGLALLWTMLVAIAVVWRLTRDHRTIAAVARRVAAGDYDARIHLRGGDREVMQLAQDVDAMIDHLGILIGLQQRSIANAAHELRDSPPPPPLRPRPRSMPGSSMLQS